MNYQQKVRGTRKNKPGGVGGSYHAACAARNLEDHCNEASHTSIQERLIEKSARQIKHQEDVTVKTGNFKEELGAATMK